MTSTEIQTIIDEANATLPQKFFGYVECVWEDAAKRMVYKFRSEMEADQFIFEKESASAGNKLHKKIYHANLIAVFEYRS